MRRLGILLGGVLALAACSTTPRPAVPVDINNTMLAPGFLAHAASANEYEIEASQLALQASANPGVRNLANVIVADHTAMGQQVAAAASAARLAPPPPTLLPAEQSMLDQLRASGPNFDMTYQQQQIMAHQQAIAMMQGYASGGDVPALRTVASGAIPVMQKHLAMAQSLQLMAPPPPPPPPAPMTAPRPGERGERG